MSNMGPGLFEAMFYAACGLVYGTFVVVGSTIHEMTLGWDRYLYHQGESHWGLIYVAPAPAKEIDLTLVHFKRNHDGVYVQDGTLTCYNVAPSEPKQKFLVRLDLSPDHSHIFCEKDSGRGPGLHLPKSYLYEAHPLRLDESTYVLWLGADGPPPAGCPLTLDRASEYVALTVKATPVAESLSATP